MHPNIIGLRRLTLPPKDRIKNFNALCLVFEFCDTDLHWLLTSNQVRMLCAFWYDSLRLFLVWLIPPPPPPSPCPQFFTPLHIKYFLYQILVSSCLGSLSASSSPLLSLGDAAHRLAFASFTLAR